MENVMEKSKMVNTEELRMKIVNMLKNYGYYDGLLVKNGMDKKFVSGELLLIDIISSKKDFKQLKMSIQKVLDYCYENNFDEIERVMNYFYKVICKDVRKTHGGIFDKFS